MNEITATVALTGLADPQTLADWQAVRKAKRAGPITPTVVKALRREAGKAWIAENT